MNLHENLIAFSSLVSSTAEHFNIDPSLIEKDYFVTLLLKEATRLIPGLVFKGGTSLSKCYKIISRFSEDIDLSLDTQHCTQGKKKEAVIALSSICDYLPFRLVNKDEIRNHTHGALNTFRVSYSGSIDPVIVTPEIQADLTFLQKSYPCERRLVKSLIADFLQQNHNLAITSEYDLGPFEVQVQTLERTFIDKVFAVCDYYLLQKSQRNSRHIYDISQILKHINIRTPDFTHLVWEVRNDRKKKDFCPSAQDEIEIPTLLQKIIDDKFYEKDYNSVTRMLLYEPISYEEAIESLRDVINTDSFSLLSK